MSDPVTNVNIDDVLSSIRRLVAEGDRSKTAPESHPKGANGPDRLVLTPDFRVTDPQPEAGAVFKHSADRPEKRFDPDVAEADEPLLLTPEQSIPETPSDGDHPKPSLEETVASFEAQLSAAQEEWEPDGSEVKTEPTWASAGFVAAPRGRLPEADIDTTSVAPPDGLGEDAEKGRVTSEAIEDAILSSVVNEAFAPEPAQIDVPDPAGMGAPEPAEMDPLEEKTFVGHSRAADSKLPQRDDDADYGDELAQPATSDEALDHYLNQAPMIDEVALRRIVQEVVREELQGGLGERITRNVRKLVRREINNVLTHQEFN